MKLSITAFFALVILLGWQIPMKADQPPEMKTPQLEGEKSVKKPNAIQIAKKDDGKTVKAAIGKTLEIQLEGNPTTGYQWQIGEVKGKSVKSLGEPEYVAEKHNPQRLGSGGRYHVKFKAIKLGETTIELKYVRPWEKDKKPAETFRVKIEVSK